MAATNLLPGITSSKLATPRLGTHVLSSGTPGGEPILFIHGNVSSGRFYEELMAAMPPRYRCLAPDLRGYGGSDRAPIDATRGMRDFSDDVAALLRHPGVLPPGRKAHLVGWSAGGGVAMQLTIDHPELVASLVLMAPVSPYGFGGTKGLDGTPCWPDFAGCGGGGANPEFVKRIAAGDMSAESPFSPRNVMNQFYFKPPFRVPREREDVFVSEMIKMAVSDGTYPGNMQPSQHWPGVAPGALGMNNALSGRYCNLTNLIDVSPRPPILWIRGAEDQIVSDASLFDFGMLGKLGLVPGWPGESVFPPQPMVSQTRAVFDQYRARGGAVREEVFPGVGHSPHLEAPEKFRSTLLGFLESVAV
ncbi:alpha/beta fold hydrolase [Hyalangium minutum]|uniref:Beta-ketoadipate enol-lactone hydrolase n=1 Tax=Hyalangium minutum TaxID=394096 RepID=A0A085WEI2_9BACT|nr:alpha/beta hydrolase [Hyalangium minutum]KFE66095.1 Beta-ketoadipate enol-lactone hydrolase [Hyalangium minutum]